MGRTVKSRKCWRIVSVTALKEEIGNATGHHHNKRAATHCHDSRIR